LIGGFSTVSPRPLIFISAVSRELRSARQLVANTLTFLGYQPVWQDIFGTETGDLRSVLREKIDLCKGLVQLVGQSYGVEPPTADEEFGRTSYTQYEALYARKRGKKVWYLFIDESFPIDAYEPEPTELRELQTAYRRRLQCDTHVFHPLTSSAALEASVLKLRDDLTRLRRGVRQWAVGVTALLAVIAGLVIWQLRSQALMKTEIKSEMAKLRQGIMAYPQMEAQVRGSQTEKDPAVLQERVYAELAKQLGVDAKLLREKLPRFAEDLKRAPDASNYERANAAYVGKDYLEAERLALQAADEARKAAPSKPKDLLQALTLAGLAAQKHVEYVRAMEHFRAAEKLTDRDRNPGEWAEVQHLIANLTLDQGQYPEAEKILRNVIEVRTHVLGSEHPDTLRSRNSLDYALWKGGKYTEAEADFLELIKREEKVLGPEHPDTLLSRHGLAITLDLQAKYADAEAQFRALIKTEERVLGAEQPPTLRSRMELAITLYEQGKYQEAEVQLRALSETEEKVLGAEHPETLRSRSNLAVALYEQGKYQEAEAEHRSLLKLREKVLGPEHPDTLLNRNNLALMLINQGKYQEAEAQFSALIKAEEKVMGAQHPATLQSRNGLAHALEGQGKYPEAEEDFRELIKLEEKILGPEHPDTLASRSGLAKTLLAEDKDAEPHIRELIRLQEKVLGSENPDTLESYYYFASGLTHRGKIQEAKEFARRAAEGARKVLGPNHPSTRKYEKLLQNLEAQR
jgi:tetratricopeptide (TPR) repeat protein